MRKPLLVIACGALAREIAQLRKLYGWEHLDLKCLDARLHNHPEQIPGKLRECIVKNRHQYSDIFVAYADCGTRGAIDRIVEEEGIERLPGAHCYQFFAGKEVFERMAEEEPGTFYLTDFLVRNFDRLVVRALQLDRHPELLSVYFGNYRRVTYLAQTRCDDLAATATRAAEYLGLEYQFVYCGYGALESGLNRVILRRDDREKNHNLLA